MKSPLILSLALMLASLPVCAQQVSPVMATYAIGKTTGELSVVNTSKSVQTYQVQIDELTVENGKLVRKPATDVRLVPSVATVQPGKRQSIRWLRTSSKTSEQFYRVRLDVVPTAEDLAKPGVLIVMHHDMPWIFRPADAAPQLSARWQGGSLVVSNTGNASARLTALVAGAKQVPGLVGYVLPGETHTFELNAKATASVSVSINGKPSTLVAQ